MFAQQLVNAIALSAAYVLVALAFSLVTGVLGVLNMAVPELFMAGAYVGITCMLHGTPLWVAFVAGAAAAALLGAIVERIGYAPFRRAPIVVPLLSTLGLSIILQNLATNIWGSDPVQLENVPLSGSVQLGPASIEFVQILMIVVAVGLVAAVAIVVMRSKLGLGLRAVAENRNVASLLGVPSSLVSVAAFAISGFLAGSAGVLVALNYGAVTPYIGVDIGLKGIAVMVVGGVDRVWGVLLAAPIVGIAQVMTSAYGGSSYHDLVVYGILIVMLLLRPQGLLGGKRLAFGRV